MFSTPTQNKSVESRLNGPQTTASKVCEGSPR